MKLRSMLHEMMLRFRHARDFPLSLLRGDSRPVGRLYAKVIRMDGESVDLGLISTKLVTTAGVDWIAALYVGTNTATGKYHQSGTGTTAPAITDTALQTAIAGVATGSLSATGNVVTTVGTVTYSGTFAVTEWGLFTGATGSGTDTLIDRATFAAINVVSTDSIQFTFTLTFPTGG